MNAFALRAAALVLPAYVALLPLQRLGLPVFGHRFSAADAVLSVAFLVYLPGTVRGWAEGERAMDAAALRLGAGLAAFICAAALSIAASRAPGIGMVSLVPYLYAAALVLLFARLVVLAPADFDRRLHETVAASLGLLAVGAIIPASFAPSWTTVAFDTSDKAVYAKYMFLLEGPTQLSVLAVMYFAILALLRAEGRARGVISDVLAPAAFANILLLNGSRIAPLSGILLLIVFWGVLFKEVLGAAPSNRRARVLILSLSLGLTAFVGAYQLDGPRTLTAYRSLSGVQSLIVRMFPFLNDRLMEHFSAHEHLQEAYLLREVIDHLASSCFVDHPALGIGLGQFVGNYGMREVHNTLLGVAAEMGIAGLIGLGLIFAELVRTVWLAWLGVRFQALARALILLAVLLPHWVHFLLRERWVWLFFLVFVFAPTDRTRQTKDSRRDVAGSRA